MAQPFAVLMTTNKIHNKRKNDTEQNKIDLLLQ